jgi:hypothetical protein
LTPELLGAVLQVVRTGFLVVLVALLAHFITILVAALVRFFS